MLDENLPELDRFEHSETHNIEFREQLETVKKEL